MIDYVPAMRLPGGRAKDDAQGARRGREGAADDEEVELQDEDLTAYLRETIDLGEMIREQFYLALPMKPLCRDDCQGLCPSAGRTGTRDRASARANGSIRGWRCSRRS